MMKARYSGLIIFLLILLAGHAAVYGNDSDFLSPFEYKVSFSDTLKLHDFEVESNIIDTFIFEGMVHWTESTRLYARIKVDNWSDGSGGILFGSELDQRYDEHYDEIFDKAFLESNVLNSETKGNTFNLNLLGGYNAGGVLNERWTVFDFENYRLAGIRGVVLQGEASVYDNLYLKGAMNPALGSSNTVWKGLNGAVSEEPDILFSLSWRDTSWWTEAYWDSYAQSDASGQGSDLSLLGQAAYYHHLFNNGISLKGFERLEYGFSDAEEDHMRLALAAGVVLPVLSGLDSNLSFNGFYLDRKEMNIAWDAELMYVKSLGVFLGLGGIRLGYDPDFIYETGLSARFDYLSILLGYSDHKGGNAGWFSGGFDTSAQYGKGLFICFEIIY